MANASVDAVVEKVKQARYASQFRDVFGEDVFGDATLATNAVLLALEVFQEEASGGVALRATSARGPR